MRGAASPSGPSLRGDLDFVVRLGAELRDVDFFGAFIDELEVGDLAVREGDEERSAVVIGALLVTTVEVAEGPHVCAQFELRRAKGALDVVHRVAAGHEGSAVALDRTDRVGVGRFCLGSGEGGGDRSERGEGRNERED